MLYVSLKSRKDVVTAGANTTINNTQYDDLIKRVLFFIRILKKLAILNRVILEKKAPISHNDLLAIAISTVTSNMYVIIYNITNSANVFNT